MSNSDDFASRFMKLMEERKNMTPQQLTDEFGGDKVSSSSEVAHELQRH